MEIKIFYSWQSDRHIPNGVNRTFIGNALEKVAKEIRNNSTVSVDPVIDRDTQGLPGTPNIIDEILKKIDSSAVFVCDLTIINNNSKFRKMPNPNVLLELGYALKVLGWDRILMIVNEAFGNARSLPFDLPWRRAITYELPSDGERDGPRKMLEGKLRSAIESILKLPEIIDVTEITEIATETLSRAELMSRQAKFQEDRSSWLSSEQGISDVRIAINEVYTEILEQFSRDAEPNQVLKNECIRGSEQNQYKMSLVYRNMMAFNLEWHSFYRNSVGDSGLAIEVKSIGIRQDRNRKRMYRADVDSDWNVIWYEETDKAKRFKNKELATRIYEDFLTEIELLSGSE